MAYYRVSQITINALPEQLPAEGCELRVNLRNIEETDLESCAQLYARVFSSEPWREAWTPEEALTRLSHFYESKGFVGVLAEQNGIAGFALGNTEPFYYGTLFYLREMCTHTDLQSRGIGSRVYSTLEQRLRSIKVKGIYLATDRAIPASQFYLGRGFARSENIELYSKQFD